MTSAEVLTRITATITLHVDLDPDIVDELLEKGYTAPIIRDLAKNDLRNMTLPRFPNSPIIDVEFEDVQLEAIE